MASPRAVDLVSQAAIRDRTDVFIGRSQTRNTHWQRCAGQAGAWELRRSQALTGRENSSCNQRTPEEVLALVESEGIEIVDFRFCDLPGLMQHFSVPAHELTEDGFEEGFGFDGSSIRGFQEIQESDMLLFPDPNTAVHRPVPPAQDAQHQLLRADPVTGESYSRDPRYVAKKAEDYLVSTGLADTAYFGPGGRVLHLQRHPLRPELPRGLLPDRLDRGASGTPARTRSPNLGFKPRYKEGYFPVPPMDHFQDLRSEMILDHGAARHRDRGPAPRGGHRRPGRDRHALRHPARRWPTS